MQIIFKFHYFHSSRNYYSDLRCVAVKVEKGEKSFCHKFSRGKDVKQVFSLQRNCQTLQRKLQLLFLRKLRQLLLQPTHSQTVGSFFSRELTLAKATVKLAVSQNFSRDVDVKKVFCLQQKSQTLQRKL